MILILLYPLLFLLPDLKKSEYHAKKGAWVIYGVLTASAMFLCYCAASDRRLPNPLDWLAMLLGQ